MAANEVVPGFICVTHWYEGQVKPSYIAINDIIQFEDRRLSVRLEQRTDSITVQETAEEIAKKIREASRNILQEALLRVKINQVEAIRTLISLKQKGTKTKG